MCTHTGCYLLLVHIVSGVCFQHHQLATVLKVSLSIFQMTFEFSCITRMESNNDFCDIAPMYVKHINENSCFSEVTETSVLLWVKIPSDYLPFCFHQPSIPVCQNL